MADRRADRFGVSLLRRAGHAGGAITVLPRALGTRDYSASVIGRKPRVLTPTGVMTNVEIVGQLAAMQATADEAASFFGVSQPTWNARLKAHPQLRQAWDAGRATATISLRRLLFNKALLPTGDGTRACLYLGRQLLWPRDDGGFIEKPESEADGGLTGEQRGRLSAEDQAKLAEIVEKLKS